RRATTSRFTASVKIAARKAAAPSKRSATREDADENANASCRYVAPISLRNSFQGIDIDPFSPDGGPAGSPFAAGSTLPELPCPQLFQPPGGPDSLPSLQCFP